VGEPGAVLQSASGEPGGPDARDRGGAPELGLEGRGGKQLCTAHTRSSIATDMWWSRQTSGRSGCPPRCTSRSVLARADWTAYTSEGVRCFAAVRTS
jgi:hypothetical protein